MDSTVLDGQIHLDGWEEGETVALTAPAHTV